MGVQNVLGWDGTPVSECMRACAFVRVLVCLVFLLLWVCCVFACAWEGRCLRACGFVVVCVRSDRVLVRFGVCVCKESNLHRAGQLGSESFTDLGQTVCVVATAVSMLLCYLCAVDSHTFSLLKWVITYRSC